MEIQIIDNKKIFMDEVLKEGLSWAEEVNIAVAYGTYSAFMKYNDDFTGLMERNGKLRVLLDIEKRITDPQLIEEFATIPGDSQCKVYYKPLASRPPNEPYRASYHPKFFVFKKANEVTAIIGSSNFTLSGIRNNVEINLKLIGDQKKDMALKDLSSLFHEIWNEWYALDVLDNAPLIKTYRKICELDRKEESRKQKNTDAMLKELEKQADASVKRAKASLNKEIAYIWGLSCGAGTINKVKRELSLRIHGIPLNLLDKKNRGYVFVQGVSKIRILQDEALERDAENITEQLNNLFTKSDSGDIAICTKKSERNYFVEVTFSKDSPYWVEILRMAKITHSNDIKKSPRIPSQILSANKSLKLAFIRGYFDVRSRLSKGDVLPNGALRVALGVGTYAEKFGIEMEKMLRDGFDVKSAKLASGKSRGRDNLLRMNPRELRPGMLSSHWKTLLLKDFKKYNEVNFPKYVPAKQKKQLSLL
ncbi:phospholipase D-like domain-containing protein [Chloroflexota bacterium]